MRTISRVYQDPVDLIWIHAARRLGVEVERSSEVFASWDGNGTLLIGTPETLDPDDSLAQMILHELCHWLVEGPDAITLPDWGLQNDPGKRIHEHATLRLQAALADTVGLRSFFAATTIFRKYFDALPASPLEGVDDPAIALANVAWNRSRTELWRETLDDALQKTAEVARIVESVSPDDSVWKNEP